jgi:hypothetical protein
MCCSRKTRGSNVKSTLQSQGVDIWGEVKVGMMNCLSAFIKDFDRAVTQDSAAICRDRMHPDAQVALTRNEG